jgi:DNA-binding LytR/AlgR family response regulator
MRRWRVLAVEDEEVPRRLLSRFLDQIPEADYVIVESGPEALKKLTDEKWDIVLLDIEMAEVNGLYLMNYISSLPEPPAVIFMTAYSEHAVTAYAGGAVDYLLKPFSLERLRQAFQRTERHLSALAPTSDKVTLPVADRFIVLPVSQIVAAFIEGEQLFVETREGALQAIRTLTLKELEEKLPHPPFLRVSRQCVLNLDAVQEVIPWFSGRYKLLLHTGRVYYCSREFASHLRRTLGLRS